MNYPTKSDLNCVIMNGRIESDTNGEFTFISGTHSSVNDYGCVRVGLPKYFQDFTEVPQQYSDHQHIVINMKMNKPKVEKINRMLKLSWNDNNITQYHNRINELLSECLQEDHTIISISKKNCYT